MSKLYTTLIIFCVVFLSCQHKSENQDFPHIIPSLSYDTIIEFETRNIQKINATIYGINITDSINLNDFDYNKIDSFVDEYLFASRNGGRLQSDSLLVFLDTSSEIFHSSVIHPFYDGFITFVPPPFPAYPIIDSIYIKEYDNFEPVYDTVLSEEIKLSYEKLIEDYQKTVNKNKRIHQLSYPVYIFNASNKERIVQKPIIYDLFLFVEAQDINGEWKSIEYWHRENFLCGTGHMDYLLQPKSYIVSSVRKYHGDFKTNLRVKLKSFDNVFYSNVFQGNIYYSQFDKTEVIDDLKARFKSLNSEDLEFIINTCF